MSDRLSVASHRRSRRTFVRSLLAVALVVGALGSVPLGARAADQGLTRQGRVTLPTGTNQFDGKYVAMDPVARRVVVAVHNGQELLSYDMDTMRLMTQVVPPISDIVGSVEYAVDTATHRLFLTVAPHNNTSIGRDIDVFDTRTLAITATYWVKDFTGGGFMFSPTDQILYGINRQPMRLVAIDVKPGSPTIGQELWVEYAGPACQQTAADQYWQVVLGDLQVGSSRYMFTMCELQGIPSQGAGAVARFTIPSDVRTAMTPPIYNGQVDIYPGIVLGGIQFGGLWDPKDARLVAFTAQASGFTAYVFDARTTSYVGAPPALATGNPNVSYTWPGLSAGVDPVSGRIFAEDVAIAQAQKNGANCPYFVPSATRFAVVEAGLLGNSSYSMPTDDATLFGDAHQMSYDPVAHNIWMVDDELAPADCQPITPSAQSYLTVYHDSLPPAAQAKVPDPDLGTTGMAEVPGQTGANFGAQASAFGARYQVTPSGSEGPLTNGSVPGSFGTLDCSGQFFQTALGYSTLNVPVPPVPPQYHSFCNAGNRDATFAHVAGLAMDASEVRATSVAADTNQATAQDLATGTNLSQPGPYANTVVGYWNGTTNGQANVPPPCTETLDSQGNNHDSCAPPDVVAAYLGGAALPYSPASCQDPGTANNVSNHGTVSVPLPSMSPAAVSVPGKSDVFCSYGTPKATGDASVSGVDVGLPIFAHDTESDAQVLRTSSGTLPDGSKAVANASVSVAHTVVNGLTVGGVLYIGRLETWATVWAHGRAQESSAIYQCKVSDVIAASVSIAGTDDCWNTKVQSIIDGVNKQLTGIARVDVVTPYGDPHTSYSDPSTYPMGSDGQVVQASPKGYLARVTASKLTQIGNTIMLSDRSIEQPALTVTVYMDTQQERDRLVATFAGVAATATYGIFPLDSQDSSSFGALPSLAASTPDSGVVAPISPTVPDVVPPVVTGPGGGGAKSTTNPIQALVQAVVDGVRLLWQNPGAIPPLIAMWLLLASPVYLAFRQRALATPARRT